MLKLLISTIALMFTISCDGCNDTEFSDTREFNEPSGMPTQDRNSELQDEPDNPVENTERIAVQEEASPAPVEAKEDSPAVDTEDAKDAAPAETDEEESDPGY